MNELDCCDGDDATTTTGAACTSTWKVRMRMLGRYGTHCDEQDQYDPYVVWQQQQQQDYAYAQTIITIIIIYIFI